jgi:signal transduction histidine kinase
MSEATDTFEDARQAFAQISQSLLTSYATLSERASYVEDQLCRTNKELESKVAELDTVTRDLEAVLFALPTGVVVRDTDGKIVRVNPAAQRILGVTANELLGRDGHELLAGEHATDEPRKVTRADGAALVLVSRYSEVGPGLEGDDAPRGSVEILDDRTEVARLTQRLHTMDKVAALATMAGGIAHEIRNPLNGVQGFATLLRRELDVGSKAAHWAGLIVEGAQEANAIVSSILCLARPEQLVVESIEPSQLLEEAVRAALPPSTSSSETSPWTVTTRSSTRPYVGDRIKLRQAIRNLVANAIDVQPEGGTIDVRQFEDAGDVVIEVSDSGPGIPEHIRGNVTDPFFTTRAEGTGLGLALVSTIAQAHGGRIEVSPEASFLGGAQLSLRFPLSPVFEKTSCRSTES